MLSEELADQVWDRAAAVATTARGLPDDSGRWSKYLGSLSSPFSRAPSAHTSFSAGRRTPLNLPASQPHSRGSTASEISSPDAQIDEQTDAQAELQHGWEPPPPPTALSSVVVQRHLTSPPPPPPSLLGSLAGSMAHIGSNLGSNLESTPRSPRGLASPSPTCSGALPTWVELRYEVDHTTRGAEFPCISLAPPLQLPCTCPGGALEPARRAQAPLAHALSSLLRAVRPQATSHAAGPAPALACDDNPRLPLRLAIWDEQ